MTQIVAPEQLILPFNRPEYFSVPEALVSAIAWRAYERTNSDVSVGRGTDDPTTATGKTIPTGYMYHAEPRIESSVNLKATRPTGTTAAALGSELKITGGWSTAANDKLLGEAAAASVLGIRIEKTGNQPASPMSPALALMQDPRGILVKSAPPDFGDIIEAIYTVGHKDVPKASATEKWVQAADKRLEIDPILAELDKALMSGVLNGAYTRRKNFPIHSRAHQWVGLYPNTPFEWFAESWVALTTDEWVEALPARVWVDWASTLLRLGVGLGFLWEYSWYETIGDAILSNEIPDTFSELVESVKSPLPWQSSHSATSVRDVGGIIKGRISRGDKVRAFLRDHLQKRKDSSFKDDLDALGFLRQMTSHSNDLRQILADKSESAKLSYETVKYGLQTRKSSGPYTDYYGILKTKGTRYVVVEPGTEWIAVVASLTCAGPGKQCNVGSVLKNLSRMGMQPELNELITLLESAGLARGSADADNAVIVESAF